VLDVPQCVDQRVINKTPTTGNTIAQIHVELCTRQESSSKVEITEIQCVVSSMMRSSSNFLYDANEFAAE
jgi:hypothetical protein